jgi:superfamily II DNA/RNA helicase
LESVGKLVAEHAPEQKVVVLVESYPQAAEIGDAVAKRMSGDLVLVPDAGAEEQHQSIDEFRSNEYKVIVGPGEVLGRGVDMPEADIAINIAKGGVNASLIQRIGRVLRNPDGDKEAHFYHIVTLPGDDDAILYGNDGRRHLQRASEFRGLGQRLRELPGYAAHDGEVKPILRGLEKEGARAIAEAEATAEDLIDDEIAAGYLSELLDHVNTTDDETSVLISQWDGETLEQPHDSTPESPDTPEDKTDKSPVASSSGPSHGGQQIDIEEAVDAVNKSSESGDDDEHQTESSPSSGRHQSKLTDEDATRPDQVSPDDSEETKSVPSGEDDNITPSTTSNQDSEKSNPTAEVPDSEKGIAGKVRSMVSSLFGK